MQAGYSGTPLAKKLGIKPGLSIRLVNPPDHYAELFSDLPADFKELKDKKVKKDFIHYFTKSVVQLKKDLQQLRQEINENGMIWISWPKKASGVPTDLTEDIIRMLALANGLVDVKVCAVDEIWSGLKLVIPLKDRKR